MFIYFHKNKFLGNEKGQLAPLFIIIIVVLVIMAFVTVNLSKIATVKTESSNAADAAALAGGSVMANVFNSITQANDEMATAYLQFHATTMALFAIAEGLLIAGRAQMTASLLSGEAGYALSAGCTGVCGGSGKLVTAAMAEAIGRNLITKLYTSTVMSIIIGITAYSIATYFHYQLIRDMAEEGRQSAMKIAHQFAFMNSGIGAKLKEGRAPDEIADPDVRRNYRDEFSDFMDRFSEDSFVPADEYTYSWKDGQSRSHSVRVRVDIDEVDTFRLKTTVLPWEAEEALLILGMDIIIAFLYSAGAALLGASCICMACCNNPWTAAFCCPCWKGLCAAGMALIKVGLFANKLALFKSLAAWQALLLAAAGLTPGPIIRDDSGNVLWATICWIDDVVHNRMVQVDTWQSHEGADTGLWQTSYPQIHSFSLVDFTGHGKIYPPIDDNKKFDPSIVATDVIGESAMLTGPQKECPKVVREYNKISEEREGFLYTAQEYQHQEEELGKLVITYQEQEMSREDIDAMQARMLEARSNKEKYLQDAADKLAERDQWKVAHPQCF